MIHKYLVLTSNNTKQYIYSQTELTVSTETPGKSIVPMFTLTECQSSASLRSKRFQSIRSYCAKLGRSTEREQRKEMKGGWGARKKKLPSLHPPRHFSCFLFSQLSRRTRAETLALQAGSLPLAGSFKRTPASPTLYKVREQQLKLTYLS